MSLSARFRPLRAEVIYEIMPGQDARGIINRKRMVEDGIQADRTSQDDYPCADGVHADMRCLRRIGRIGNDGGADERGFERSL